jgi:hypothetical protein
MFAQTGTHPRDNSRCMLASLRSFVAHIDSHCTVSLTETAEDLWQLRVSGPELVYSLNIFRSAEQAQREAEIFVRHHLKRSSATWQGLSWCEQKGEPTPADERRAVSA